MSRKLMIVVFAFAASLMLIAAGCAVNTPTQEKPADDTRGNKSDGSASKAPVNLTLKGSDTMVILGQRWAEEFMNENDNYVIQVTGGGSGTGIAALINQTTDIAQASRPIKEEEKKDAETKSGEKVIETPVALDGLAIFVNEKNGVNDLTLEQIAAIYTGKIKNWKEVGGKDAKMILYGRESNSGTYVYFKEEVLDDADYAAETQTLSGTAAVVNAVANDANGIGYGGIAYGKGVKFAGVKKDANSKSVQPSLETVQSNEYPISRNLYWYMYDSVAAKPEVQSLLEWVLSDSDGQALAEEVGYYPLNK